MPYEKQTFENGDVLDAESLNHMEQGIYDNSVAVENAETHLPVIGTNGNWHLWDGNQYVDSGETSRGEGEPGYTPVRGVDYFTPEDVADIVGQTKAQIAAGEQYELIESLTTTEEVSEIRRTVEPDGTAYHFKRIMVNIYCPAAEAKAAVYIFDGGTGQLGYLGGMVNTTDTYARVIIDVSRGYLESLCFGPDGKNNYPAAKGLSASAFRAVSVIDALRFVVPTGTIPIGTKIDIYGVRINPAGSIDALADEIIGAQENYIGGDA